MTTTKKLIECSLTSLIGLNINGVMAQVRNPIYINSRTPPKWRKLIKVVQFKENGKNWIELFWEPTEDDSCNFTGCTVESDTCRIQFTPEELKKTLKS